MRAQTRIYSLALAGLLMGLAACRATGENVAPLDTVNLCAKTDTNVYPIVAELAQTSEQRRKGLMGRETLGDNQGMLFVYDRPRSPDATFWMYRTLIPLDIAYLSKDGEIRAIREMRPCESEEASQCPSYKAGVDHQHALEMPQGFFQQRNIGTNDHIMRLDKNQKCELPPN
ncbi:DUF192 domain-containing protein [Marinobacter fonticola]|uniref:DUF192 domain-containing protein n=1 Tax=Marinobacter fonticola TaxID=2603215 RepID=UPI0011E6EDF5|nr:DUF192 domain-containing protein [Marinobacter fonticola]